MLRAILIFGVLSLPAALPCFAQSDAPAPSMQTNSSTSSSTPAGASTEKIWTNENLAGDSATGVASSTNRQSQKNNGKTNAQGKGGDPATATRIKQSLQKIQTQLADIDLKLENYKRFLQGENVPDPGKDIRKGYNRTPIDQQMAALQEKKKQLELQMDALYEEARKKEIEPGQLR